MSRLPTSMVMPCFISGRLLPLILVIRLPKLSIWRIHPTSVPFDARCGWRSGNIVTEEIVSPKSIGGKPRESRVATGAKISRPWKVALTGDRQNWGLVMAIASSSGSSSICSGLTLFPNGLAEDCGTIWLRTLLSGATKSADGVFRIIALRPVPTPGSATTKWIVLGGKNRYRLCLKQKPLGRHAEV